MITERHRRAFRERGLVRLERFARPELVARARAVVVGTLERHGARRGPDCAWSFMALDGPRQARGGLKLTKSVKRSRAFRELMTPELVAAVEALLEEPVKPMLQNPQLLLKLPSADPWAVPHTVWHTDLLPIRNQRVPGAQAFICLDVVEPRGGGTVVVAGSHRLLGDVERIGSKQVKRRLLREEYFRELMSRETPDRDRFLNEARRVGDVDLQVVELHGEPGDVYLMDLRLLHAPAPNASRRPRMVVTHRYVRQQVHHEISRMLEEAAAGAPARS